MTNNYMIHAWCIRPFIACIDIEAETPDEAIKKARSERQWLYDTAEECNGKYPWDEFAAHDEKGRELLHVLDDNARLRDAAPALLKALNACVNYMADDLDESDETESRIVRQACAALAQAGPISRLPLAAVGISSEASERGFIRELLEAIEDLLGDLPSVQDGVCRHCGREYDDFPDGDCPSDDCPSFKSRAALAQAQGRK